MYARTQNYFVLRLCWWCQVQRPIPYTMRHVVLAAMRARDDLAQLYMHFIIHFVAKYAHSSCGIILYKCAARMGAQWPSYVD